MSPFFERKKSTNVKVKEKKRVSAGFEPSDMPQPALRRTNTGAMVVESDNIYEETFTSENMKKYSVSATPLHWVMKNEKDKVATNKYLDEKMMERAHEKVERNLQGKTIRSTLRGVMKDKANG